MTPRIPPMEAPYPDGVGERLESMMPAGVAPIALFRTFVHNLPMTDGLAAWGRYELSRDLSISMRDREIVIDRTTARCGCEYEWGVHVLFFAERVGLTDTQVSSIVHGDSSDPCWSDDRDRVLLDAVDELHDTSALTDATWERLAGHFDAPQLLDVLLLAGWYHAISYVANGARVALEDGAPRFDDVRPAAPAA